MVNLQSGAQHKLIVKYAPSQRVPKPIIKKDGCEGTIDKGSYRSDFCSLMVLNATHHVLFFYL